MACLFVTCRWSCSHNEPNPKQRFLYYLATCVIFTWPYLVYCGKIGQLLTFMTQYNLCSILRKLFIYYPLYFSAWKVEHHDVWLDGKRQDFVGSDHRQMPRCSLRHLRLHDSHHGGGWKYLKFNQKFCQTFCLLVGLCWRGHWVCGGQAASGSSSCCRIWDMPLPSPGPAHPIPVLEIEFGPPHTNFGSVWSSQKAHKFRQIQPTTKVRLLCFDCPLRIKINDSCFSLCYQWNIYFSVSHLFVI